MNFPLFRKHHNGNTFYKLLSHEKMVMVHNMANIVFKMEVTNNRFVIEDALNTDFSRPADPAEWERVYNQVLRKVIDAGM